MRHSLAKVIDWKLCEKQGAEKAEWDFTRQTDKTPAHDMPHITVIEKRPYH